MPPHVCHKHIHTLHLSSKMGQLPRTIKKLEDFYGSQLSVMVDVFSISQLSSLGLLVHDAMRVESYQMINWDSFYPLVPEAICFSFKSSL